MAQVVPRFKSIIKVRKWFVLVAKKKIWPLGGDENAGAGPSMHEGKFK